MTLPNFTAQRAAIAALLEEVPDVTVYAAAPHGTLPAQFVIVGMPTWRPPTEAVCMDSVEWGVMVCVARSGTNDTFTALALEGLWPLVLAALDEAVEADATLGGLCSHSSLKDAEFAPVTIQGQEYPAQIITLTLQGA